MTSGRSLASSVEEMMASAALPHNFTWLIRRKSSLRNANLYKTELRTGGCWFVGVAARERCDH